MDCDTSSSISDFSMVTPASSDSGDSILVVSRESMERLEMAMEALLSDGRKKDARIKALEAKLASFADETVIAESKSFQQRMEALTASAMAEGRDRDANITSLETRLSTLLSVALDTHTRDIPELKDTEPNETKPKNTTKTKNTKRKKTKRKKSKLEKTEPNDTHASTALLGARLSVGVPLSVTCDRPVTLDDAVSESLDEVDPDPKPSEKDENADLNTTPAQARDDALRCSYHTSRCRVDKPYSFDAVLQEELAKLSVDATEMGNLMALLPINDPHKQSELKSELFEWESTRIVGWQGFDPRDGWAMVGKALDRWQVGGCCPIEIWGTAFALTLMGMTYQMVGQLDGLDEVGFIKRCICVVRAISKGHDGKFLATSSPSVVRSMVCRLETIYQGGRLCPDAHDWTNLKAYTFANRQAMIAMETIFNEVKKLPECLGHPWAQLVPHISVPFVEQRERLYKGNLEERYCIWEQAEVTLKPGMLEKWCMSLQPEMLEKYVEIQLKFSTTRDLICKLKTTMWELREHKENLRKSEARETGRGGTRETPSTVQW